MAQFSVSDISADLAARIDSLARDLYRDGHKDGLEWRVSSIHGEKGKSLGIHLGEGSKRGTWKDFATGEGGDPLDLIRARFGFKTTGEAVRWAKNWLGMSDGQPDSPEGGSPPASRSQDSRYQAIALKTWQQSLPADGTVVETYLRSRGITVPVPSSLRHHPHLKHREAGRFFPGMVAQVSHPDGSFMAIHRTYLAKDGRGKAFSKHDTFDSKKALGAVSGGAIHLAPVGSRLGLCEGIETALSVMQCWPGLTVWATLSVPGLTSVKLPEDVRLVLIFADADPPDDHGRHPGQDAAWRAARRFEKEGRTVTTILPPIGKDWNDLLVDGTLGSLRAGQVR